MIVVVFAIATTFRTPETRSEMTRACALLLAFAFASSVQASPRTDAEAEAAIAIAKAKLKLTHVEAPPPLMSADYATARSVALKADKTLFVRVGHGPDCSETCAELVDCATLCHTDSLYGDSTFRFVLAVPSNGKLWYARSWKSVPDPNEVKAEIKRHQVPQVKQLGGASFGDCLNGQCAPSFRIR